MYVGATTQSSLTAELSAIVWALAWSSQASVRMKRTINYDYTSAAMTATSEWYTDRHVRLVQTAMCVLAVARVQHTVS
eukprot:8361142-Alexandrium_andersonii.AAC.1